MLRFEFVLGFDELQLLEYRVNMEVFNWPDSILVSL